MRNCVHWTVGRTFYINLSLLPPPSPESLANIPFCPLWAWAGDDTSWGLFVTAACLVQWEASIEVTWSALSNQRPVLTCQSRSQGRSLWGEDIQLRRLGKGWALIFSLHSLAPQTGWGKSKVLSLDVANLALDLSLWLPSGLAPQPLTSSPGHWLGLSHWLLIFF